MVLLIFIYLAFISLGLPDAVLGSVWPIMHKELGLALSSAGLIGAIVSTGTVLSALFSHRMIKRFGTWKVTVISVFATAVGLWGYSISANLLHLVLWALPLGLGAGSVDAVLNNYVALHYKSRHMNWLHSFWGLGASAGPALVALVMSFGFAYKSGYLLLSILQMILVVSLLFTKKMWDDHQKPTVEEHLDQQHGSAVAKGPLIYILLAFLFYCGLEVSLGLWSVTYLTQTKHLAVEVATRYGSFFFVGITVGRMLSGFATFRLSNMKLIIMGLIIAFVGVVALRFSSLALAPVALLLSGVGCAPVFPSLLHETPRRFGPEASQKVIGYEMACAYLGSTLTPLLTAILVRSFGLHAIIPFMITAFGATLFSVLGLLFLDRRKAFA